MVVIDGLIDFIIDYNLILFIPHMLENAVFISTLSFSHEVFAVLNGSEEDSESWTEVGEGLNKKNNTIKATAADFWLE